jgi:hypothetical protein
VLTQPLVHPDRPQPPLQPPGRHHRGLENGFLSEILHGQGYNTYAVGKWHLTPADQVSAAGPYDRWPLGRGFDRFYGFLGGDTHQYYPELVADNHRVEPERTPEEGYHLTGDLVDKATAFVAEAKQVAPNKPFFLYFATGAMHAPHHVPKEWADRYQGVFDDGWDASREQVFARQKELGIVPADAELSRHDPDVTPWADCSAEERRLYARMMEVRRVPGAHRPPDRPAAGLPARARRARQHPDHGPVRQRASSEGGPSGSVNENLFFNFVPESLEQNLAAIDDLGGPKYFNHYPWGWTWAGNTPFRRWKRETYRGGISDPIIVHWPAGIQARGEVRSQYAHAIDMVPPSLMPWGSRPRPSSAGSSSRPSRGSASPTPSTTPTPPPTCHPVLRDAGPPLDLPRRLAGGLPLAGTVVRRGGQAVRHPDAGRDPHRAVSNHLACLRWCGFVTARRAHRRVYYSIADRRVTEMLELACGLLEDNADHVACCGVLETERTRAR